MTDQTERKKREADAYAAWYKDRYGIPGGGYQMGLKGWQARAALDGESDRANVELVMALQLIADSHLPDMPAAAGDSEKAYALNHIARLRRYAKQALDKRRSPMHHKSDCALHGVDTGIKTLERPDGISYDGPCDCEALDGGAVSRDVTGWKLVPVTATDEMTQAAWDGDATDYVGEHHRIHNAGDAYRAMIEAAPNYRWTDDDEVDCGGVPNQYGDQLALEEWRRIAKVRLIRISHLMHELSALRTPQPQPSAERDKLLADIKRRVKNLPVTEFAGIDRSEVLAILHSFLTEQNKEPK